MAEKASRIWFWGVLLATALASASLTISLINIYSPLSQRTVTITCTTTQTITETTTYIVTTSTTQLTEPTITIVSSDGRCGDLDEPLLTFTREGEYVLLRYLEATSVPCYRHVVVKSVVLERWPPIIDITLELESTSEVCVECVGIIETTLRVGLVPDGVEIVVNGLRVVM